MLTEREKELLLKLLSQVQAPVGKSALLVEYEQIVKKLQSKEVKPTE